MFSLLIYPSFWPKEVWVNGVFDDYVRATGLDREFLKSIKVEPVHFQGRDRVRVPYFGGGPRNHWFRYLSGDFGRGEALWDPKCRPVVYHSQHYGIAESLELKGDWYEFRANARRKVARLVRPWRVFPRAAKTPKRFSEWRPVLRS